MKKRHRCSFLLPGLVIIIAAGVLGCLWACSSDSSSPTGSDGHEQFDIAVTTRAGQVVLPGAIAALTDSMTIVSSLESVACDAGGDFDLRTYEGGPQLALALTPDGNPALSGWLSESQGTVSAHTTAQVLLYYALGGFCLPSGSQQEVIEAIAASVAADNLAAVIEAVIADDPYALAHGDSTIALALEAEVMGLMGLSPAGAPRPDEKLARALGIVVNPPTRLSGVSVDLTAGLNRFRLVNEFRRRAHLYLDRVSYVSGEGQEVLSGSAVMEVEIRPVQGLSGVTSTITDVFGGNAAFTPVATESVLLPMVDSAQSVRYRLAMVGPGGW